MPTGATTLRTYLALADWYEGQSQAQMRDRFLLLAADTALAEGRPDEAERLRLRLLEHSPHHMLRPFASFSEALGSPDVQGYLNDLRQTYPPETAEQLLASVEAELAKEPGPPAAPRPAPAPAPARETAAPAPEPLKVFRVKDEEGAPRPAPAAAPARRPPAPRKDVLPAAPAEPSRHGPAPVARPVAPPPGTRPPGVAPPMPLSQAAAPPTPYPLRREPIPARPAPPALAPSREDDEAAERGGGWVAVGLFVLVLLAGVALAAYTFAKPFLPPQWLP
jgi:hypothetical protein